MATLNDQGLSFEHPPISSNRLACLLDRVADNIIPTQVAKTIFSQLITSTKTIDELIAASGYQQADNSQIESIIRATLDNYPQQVADYRAGKDKLFSFFVGQVMKQTKGKACPTQINTLLRKYLE